MLRTLAVLSLLTPSIFRAQETAPVPERTYPFPQANVEAALKNLNAYQGARLPSLDGFVLTVRAHVEHTERPYYEYKIELEPRGANQTMVRVKAKVSAWYADPSGAGSGYENFESNGRLESDLLDRLNDFLSQNGSTAGADPASLQRRLEEVRRQRLEAESRVSALKKELDDLRKGGKPETGGADYIAVARPRAAVLSAPEPHATVLAQAQAEDEFELLERRGAWVRVKLGDKNSGWLKNADVALPAADPSPPAQSAQADPAAGFSVIREMVATFSGEWAPLQGKQALYVWARPEGSGLNVQASRKLPFAQSIFMKRYREEAHTSDAGVAGIVVIFLDQAGGVAAASMDDIRSLADGSITPQAFARKCSLDPASAFRSSPATAEPPKISR